MTEQDAEQDTEVWVRYNAASGIDLGRTPLEPWHLQVEIEQGGGGPVPKTACGLTLTQGPVQTRVGMPTVQDHETSRQASRENESNRCLPCFQVHLKRLGFDISDAPISEDYEPHSDSVRAETGDMVVGMPKPVGRTRAETLPEGLYPLGPLPSTSPAVGRECPACFRPIEAKAYITYIPLGPGLDPDEQRAASAGVAFTAIAALVHWTCGTGLSDDVAQEIIEGRRESRVQ